MTLTQTGNKPKASIETYVNRYIRFDAPSRLPSVMCSWSNSVDEAVEIAQKLGCTHQNVVEPVPGTEIIGNTARMMIRAHNDPPAKGIGLLDQYCVFDLENELEAYKFMDCLLGKIEFLKHEVEYINRGYHPQRYKHFVVRTKDGYNLYCTSCVTNNISPSDKNAVQLFIHWKIDFHAPTRKRKSNNQAQNSDVSHGATVA